MFTSRLRRVSCVGKKLCIKVVTSSACTVILNIQIHKQPNGKDISHQFFLST